MIELLNWISSNRDVFTMIFIIILVMTALNGYILIEIINAIKKRK